MKKYLVAASLFSIITVLSCSKEIEDNVVIDYPSVENDTLAKFAIDSFDVCTDIISHTNLRTGTPLTDTDYLDVKVNISKTGPFKFSTDTLNGYYFSAEGNFNTTGAQTIKLNGHGTPLLPGHSRFSFPSSGVYHLVPVMDTTNVVVEQVPAGIYATGKWDGQDFTANSMQGLDDAAMAYDGADTTSISTFVNTWPIPAGSGALSVQKQFIYNYSTTSDAEFKEFFKPGTYPLVYDNCPTDFYQQKGVWIGWVDDSNNLWDTRPALSNEGSYFHIVGVEDGYRTDGKYYLKIHARFSCKLYKWPDYEMKEFKDVDMVSYIVRH